MAARTFRLSSIQQAVELGTSLPYHRFRGHARQYGNLIPKVFREKYRTGIDYLNEPHFASRFQLDAPSVHANCPTNDDDLGWLFLMQHHGCPTRLLDWSQSVLVATYFVVSNHHSDDGELW